MTNKHTEQHKNCKVEHQDATNIQKKTYSFWFFVKTINADTSF